MDLVEGLEKGPALSLPLPARYSALSQGLKAHFVVSSALGEAPVLQLSSSEELDVVSIETGDTKDSPPHAPAYEELIEDLTRAVAKLIIDCPEEKTGGSS